MKLQVEECPYRDFDKDRGYICWLTRCKCVIQNEEIYTEYPSCQKFKDASAHIYSGCDCGGCTCGKKI